ncbi:hypothetical protein E2562_038916, partial [Oryza meyeriana var. granulata]
CIRDVNDAHILEPRCEEEGRPISDNLASQDRRSKLVESAVWSICRNATGDHDSTISVVGTQGWLRSLNLSITDDWRPWYVNSQVVGFTRTYSNNLTYATVKEEDHKLA